MTPRDRAAALAVALDDEARRVLSLKPGVHGALYDNRCGLIAVTLAKLAGDARDIVRRMGPAIGQADSDLQMPAPMELVPSHGAPNPAGIAQAAQLLGVRPGALGLQDPLTEAFVGAGKGLAGSGYNMLRAASMAIPGATTLPSKPSALEPQGAAEQVGHFVEQGAEFLAPAGLVGKGVKAAATYGPKAATVARVALEGIGAGGVSSLQGATPEEAGASAAFSAVIPGGGAVTRTQKFLERKSEDLVRAAIKPTVTAMQRVSGASREGLNAKANELVRFIIDNKVTTADKARSIFEDAERDLQRVLSANNAPTDAATRAARYIEALERSAAKQGLDPGDVALLREAADQLVSGPMGQTVSGPSGTARLLREEVPAAEALESARASSRWTTRKSWGEQKGASMEASKAVERAQRDAVKTAVPEAKPLLKRESLALQSEKVLDRSEFRQANRDAVSLPAHVIAAGELASGRVPVLAFAANWLRDNQLKAGVWASGLAKAIERNDAPAVAAILKKLGVGVGSQTMRPVPSH